MAKQIIGIGASANDNTGDPLRTAFDKCNDNFDEIYSFTMFEEDATTSSLSLSDLNTNYPDLEQGSMVFAPDVVGGAEMYIKTLTGWISYVVNVVS